MKKILALLLTVAMLLTLAACGGGEPDPNAGMYLGVSGEMSGITLTMEELFPGESYLELKNGGKADLVLEGDKIPGKWTLEGEDFNLVVEGEDCPGTLKDGVITFDFAGSGITLVFAKDGKVSAMSVTPNLPLGLFSGFPYEGQETRIEKDMMIYMFTDGVNEAENNEKEQ